MNMYKKIALSIIFFILIGSCSKIESSYSDKFIDHKDVGEYLCYDTSPSSAVVSFEIKMNDSLKLYAVYIVTNLQGVSYIAKCDIVNGNIVLDYIKDVIILNETGLISPPQKGDVIGSIKKEDGVISMKTWMTSCFMKKL